MNKKKLLKKINKLKDINKKLEMELNLMKQYAIQHTPEGLKNLIPRMEK